MPSAKFIVSGKVQGVFFRASARSRAIALGLGGHAKNLSNGNVEVVASGSADALSELERWLRVGPSSARVEQVLRFDHSDDNTVGFSIS